MTICVRMERRLLLKAQLVAIITPFYNVCAGERRERTVFHHDLRNRVRNGAPAGTRLPTGLHGAKEENVMQSEGFMDTLMSVLLSPSEAHSRNNVLKVKLEELACHFGEVFPKILAAA